MIPLSIPSPSSGVFNLGPIPIRGYAIMIILGIVASVWVSERRWGARGGRIGDIQDIALWAVPFGVVGGRLYHVITDHDKYFGPGKSAWNALYVWHGGLGIWGAIALGAAGACIGARRKGMRILPLFDVVGPTLLLAQGIGRWGNWFNQELFGRPTSLPWGLRIDYQNRPPGYWQYSTFHPTFLYEFIWDVLMFFVVVWAERRWRLGHGRVFALYVMVYCLGRGAIETLRIDQVELQNVLGLRWSDWMSIICFLVAAAYFVWASRNRPGREDHVYDEGREPVSHDADADGVEASE